MLQKGTQLENNISLPLTSIVFNDSVVNPSLVNEMEINNKEPKLKYNCSSPQTPNTTDCSKDPKCILGNRGEMCNMALEYEPPPPVSNCVNKSCMIGLHGADDFVNGGANNGGADGNTAYPEAINTSSFLSTNNNGSGCDDSDNDSSILSHEGNTSSSNNNVNVEDLIEISKLDSTSRVLNISSPALSELGPVENFMLNHSISNGSCEEPLNKYVGERDALLHKYISKGFCEKKDINSEEVSHVLKQIRIENVNRVIICHLNVNFFAAKIDAIKTIIPGNVDIMIFCETKLDDSYPMGQLMIEGFSKNPSG